MKSYILNTDSVSHSIVNKINKRMKYLSDKFNVTCDVTFAALKKNSPGLYYVNEKTIYINKNITEDVFPALIDHEFCHHLKCHFYPDIKEAIHGKIFQSYMEKLGYSKDNFEISEKVFFFFRGKKFFGKVIKSSGN